MATSLDRPPVLITAAEGRLTALAVIFVIGSAAASVLVTLPPVGRSIALFVHLGSLVVGLGAVLSIDWYGMLWLRRRVKLADVVSHAHRTTALTWLGLVGLCVSGMFLKPDLDSALTMIKIGAVAGAAAVGVFALATGRRLRSYRGTPPAKLVGLGLILAMSSQLFWWTAVVIGFLAREGR